MKKTIIILAILLTSCNINNPNIVAEFPEDQNLKRKAHGGNMFGNKDGIILFQDKKAKAQNKEELQSDSGLWKKSLKVISSILPIDIADKDSGLITTEWGKLDNIDGASDGIYKINATITGDKIERKNINISVFRKSSSTAREAKIENKIVEMILE